LEVGDEKRFGEMEGVEVFHLVVVWVTEQKVGGNVEVFSKVGSYSG